MVPGERSLSIKWTDAPVAQPPMPAGVVTGLRANTSKRSRFEAIFARYHTAVYDYICGVMGSAEDASDLTQDTFLQVYLALPAIPDDLPAGAWVYRIATTVCLTELRRRKRITRRSWAALVSLCRPRRASRDGSEQATRRAGGSAGAPLLLAELPADARACLLLRDRQRLSYDEIAEALRTTRAAVQSLLFHAREDCWRRHAQRARPLDQVHP